MDPSMLALNQDSDTDYESDFGTFEEQTVKLGLAKKETLNNGPSTSGGKIQKSAQKKGATKSKAGRGKHVCDHCDYSTDKTDHLKNHMNAVHLKLKPHKCNQCCFSCADRSDLKRHIRKVHEKIRHQCQLCDYSTGYKQNFSRHVKSKHGSSV